MIPEIEKAIEEWKQKQGKYYYVKSDSYGELAGPFEDKERARQAAREYRGARTSIAESNITIEERTPTMNIYGKRGPFPAGTKTFPGAGYLRRVTRSPKTLPAGVERAMWQQTGGDWDKMSKLFQDWEMGEVYGSNWKEQSQALYESQFDNKSKVAGLTTQNMTTKRTPIEGFPQTQAEMAEWQEKYTFDPGTGKWYEETTTTSGDKTASLKQQIADVQAQIAQKTAQLEAAEEAGYGIGTGKEIPESIMNLDYSGNDVVDYSSDANAHAKGLISSFNDTMAEIQAKQDAMMQQYIDQASARADKQAGLLKGILGDYKDMIKDRPSMQETMESVLEEYGFTPEMVQKKKDLVSKIGAVQEEIAKVDAKMVAAEGKIDEMGMPDLWAQGRKAQVQRQAAAQKNALAAKATAMAAQAEAISGNMADAMSMANAVVKAQSADWEQRVSDFEFIASTQKDVLDIMTEAEKEIWDMTFQYNQQNLELAREEARQKMNLMIDAAANGITLPADLDMSLGEMSQMYAQSLAERAPEADWELREVGGSLYRVDPATGQMEMLMGAPAPTPGELTEEQLEALSDIRSDLLKEPAYKNYQDALMGYNSVISGESMKNLTGDLAIVSGLARMLDPGSVVRPAEFKTVEEAQSYLEQARLATRKVFTKSGLTDEARERYVSLADDLYERHKGQLESTVDKVYSPRINAYGLTKDQVVGEIMSTEDVKGLDDSSLDEDFDNDPDIIDPSGGGEYGTLPDYGVWTDQYGYGYSGLIPNQ